VCLYFYYYSRLPSFACDLKYRVRVVERITRRRVVHVRLRKSAYIVIHVTHYYRRLRGTCSSISPLEPPSGVILVGVKFCSSFFIIICLLFFLGTVIRCHAVGSHVIIRIYYNMCEYIYIHTSIYHIDIKRVLTKEKHKPTDTHTRTYDNISTCTRFKSINHEIIYIS